MNNRIPCNPHRPTKVPCVVGTEVALNGMVAKTCLVRSTFWTDNYTSRQMCHSLSVKLD
jgi:hypothetical protein